jgi:hypothetical protein
MHLDNVQWLIGNEIHEGMPIRHPSGSARHAARLGRNGLENMVQHFIGQQKLNKYCATNVD